MAGTNTDTKKKTNTRAASGTGAKKTASGTKKATTGTKRTATGKTRSNSKGYSSKSYNSKNYSTKKKSNSSYMSREEEDRAEHIVEICFFAMVIFFLFIMCSNFGFGAKFGDVISGAFFGLFGVVQYVFPIYLIISALFLLVNGPKASVVRKVVWFGVIMMIVSFIAQMIHGVDGATAKSLYFDGYRSKQGGGVLFGGIMSLLYKPVGKVGSILFIVLLSIISLIQVFNVSFIAGIRRIVNFFGSIDFRGTVDKMRGNGAYDYDDDDDDDDEYDDYGRGAADRRKASKKKTADRDKDHASENAPKKRTKSLLDRYTVYPDDDDDFGEFDDDDDDNEFGDEFDYDKTETSKKTKGKKNQKNPVRDKRKNVIVEGEEMTELHPVSMPDPFDDNDSGFTSFRQVSQKEREKASAKKDKERASRQNAQKLSRDAEMRNAAMRNISSYEEDEADLDEFWAEMSEGPEDDDINKLFEQKEAERKEQNKAAQERARKKASEDYGVRTEKASQNLSDVFQSARDISYPVEVQEDYTEDVDPDEAISSLASPIRWDSKKGEKDNTSAGSEKTVVSDGKSSESNSAKSAVTNSEKEAVGSEEIGEEIAKKEEEKPREYPFPPISLLNPPKSFGGPNEVKVKETAIRLRDTLETFGVKVKITNYSCGPAVTRYEMQPEIGVKVSKILSLQDDIKLNLAAEDIRIEAPIPGKAAIGIEIPNQDKQIVSFRELIDTDIYERAKAKSLISFAVGKDIGGQIVIGDIAKMPHVMIAGQTGSGKSVCINTLIMSILYNAGPEDVRMIMIDPKMVELSVYNGLPHLLIPVVTDPMKAAGALNWAVEEMTRRYQDFQNYSVRNIQGFNQKVEKAKERGEVSDDPRFKHMTQIVIIVDELADLMMTAHGEVEGAIVRLTQLARAAGIHLVIATQRPSVDVITGLIKANVPSRIACKVASGVDSRTILDQVGAEKLLGYGDMLFFPSGYSKPVRVQGAFLEDEEVERVADYIRDNWGNASYDNSISDHINTVASSGGSSGGASGEDAAERFDELFEDAARLVIGKDKASIGNLQRAFRIGFNRAARIMDQLEEYGVVGPEVGTKPRQVLMTIDQFEENMSL